MKNYVNKTIRANQLLGTNTLTGNLCFYEDGYCFKAEGVNSTISGPKIEYSSIAEIKSKNTFGFVPNRIIIKLRTGESYQYVVMHRKDIMKFLAYKMSVT